MAVYFNEAAVDGGVVVRFRPVLWVVGDVGRRFTLVGHSIWREDEARFAMM
jgi:hypothetical protein